MAKSAFTNVPTSMDEENVVSVVPNAKRNLGWNLKFGKKGHVRPPRIPIDESAWVKNQQGYVLAHDSMYENPNFYPGYVERMNKKKGEEGKWSFSTNTDLDKDGNLDTIIYRDKQPMFWNGFHYVDN